MISTVYIRKYGHQGCGSALIQAGPDPTFQINADPDPDLPSANLTVRLPDGNETI